MDGGDNLFSLFAGFVSNVMNGIPILVPFHSNKIRKEDLSEEGALGAAVLEDAVFDFTEQVNYVNGSIHASDMGSFSMGKALGGLVARVGRNQEVIKLDDIIVDARLLSGNMVTAGSPNSNEIAYTLFGNAFIPGKSTDTLALDPNHPLDLPIQFRSDPETIGDIRVSRGGGSYEAHWGLSVNGKVFWPKLKKEKNAQNWLETDYLVLSKLPNVFDGEWQSQGSSVFSISGLHGPGTQGFKLLLEDPHAVELLNKKLQKLNSHYWQVLIPVNKIGRISESYEGGRQRFWDVAMSLDMTDCHCFPIDIDKKISALSEFDWVAKLKAIREYKNSRS